MSVDDENQENLSGPWPSKSNRTDSNISTAEPSTSKLEKQESKYRKIAKGIAKHSARNLSSVVYRELSVSDRTKLRRECVRETRGRGNYVAKSTMEVMQSFLTWFQKQDDLYIELDNGVQMPAKCAYDKDATYDRYGKLCDLERGLHELATEHNEKIYTSLLGLTASSTNSDGKPRCPADHWTQMRQSWSNHVRQEQQRLFQDEFDAERYDPDNPPKRWWEYVRVSESHKSGYGHTHIAVITNFKVEPEDFRPVLQKHIDENPSASWSAHDLEHDDPKKRCVSVNEIDSDSDRSDAVGNLASYLSGYLSEFDDQGDYVDMLDRSPNEIMFAATAWATGTRRIDFSQGAHEIRRLGNELRPAKYRPNHELGQQTLTSPDVVGIYNAVTGETRSIDNSGGGIDWCTVKNEPQKDPEKHFAS